MYEFGPFRLDPRRRILLRGQEPVQLTSKAIELLLVLIDNRERVVLKDELLRSRTNTATLSRFQERDTGLPQTYVRSRSRTATRSLRQRCRHPQPRR